MLREPPLALYADVRRVGRTLFVCAPTNNSNVHAGSWAAIVEADNAADRCAAFEANVD
jgi:hypothetical protein